MSEMSDTFKLVNAMELAKTARVGMELTYFDVIELLGELESLKDYIAELEAEQHWHVVKECNDVATPIDVALRKRIAELEAAQRWIPVSERLPDTKILYDKFDVIVELVDIGNGEMIRRVDMLSYDYRNKSWNDDCGEFGFYPVTGVTHWRERPTPPEVQE